MSNLQKLFPLSARILTIIGVACLTVCAFVIFIGYKSVEREFEANLERASESRAEAIAQHSARVGPVTKDTPTIASDASWIRIAGALVEVEEPDQSGKYHRQILVGRRNNGKVELLEHQLGPAVPVWRDVEYHPEIAKPMSEALDGLSGIVRHAHEGQVYVSARAYIPSLNIAVVVTAKKDEALTPHVTYFALIAIFAFAVTGGATYLIFRVMWPFERAIRDQNVILRHEIEKRKTAEKELYELYRTYRDLAENINDTIYEADNDSLITYISPVVTRVLGYHPEDIIGKSFVNYIHPDDLENTIQQFKDALEGNAYSRDIRILAADDSYRWVSTSSRQVISGGEVTGVRGIFFDITSQKEADKAHQSSELKLRSITDSANEAVMLLDPKANLTFWNPAAESIFGISEADTLNRRLQELFPDTEFSRHILRSLQAGTKDLGQSGLASESVFEVHDKVGNSKTVELSLAITEILGERHAVCVVRDVTARNQANLFLRKLVLAVENSADVVFMTDREGVFTYVNPAFTRLYGYESVEVVGLCTPRILKGGNLDRKTYDNFWKTVSTGGVFKREFTNRTKKGDKVNVEVSVSSTIDEAGEIMGYLALQRDVTERNQVAAALRQSESQFRTVVESLNEGLVITNVDSKVAYLNPRMSQMCGYKSDEMLNQPVIDFIAPKWREVVANRTRERLEIGHSSTYEIELLKRDGTAFWVRVGACPWTDSEGKNVGSLALVSDISEQKEAEAVRANLESQLRQAQKMEAIGTLAGGIAHDFNNILTPIIAYTDLVLAETSEKSSTKDDLQKVMSAAQRAKELVKQILMFSRQTEQTRYALQVSPIVKEALKLLRASLPSTIEIVEHIEQSKEIVADPTQIHQIVMNLCTNAFWAMKDTGGTLTVTLKTVNLTRSESNADADLPAGQYTLLSVQDTGCGMLPEVKARIFEPFFTTKGVGEGTGLGLPVVHGIVSSAGGRIHVTSEPGTGTRFDLYFPAAPEQIPHVPDATTETLQGSGHILVVDDEVEIARICERLLASYGYTVTSRTSSQDALDAYIALSGTIDAVVTDYTMPHMTGLQLAREIHAINPEIPVIIMTGYSPSVNESNWKDLGLGGLVMKPVVGKDLAATLRTALDSIVSKDA